MKKLTRKLLSVLICCIMITGMMPVTALAEGDTAPGTDTVDMPTFSYTSDAEITRIISKYDGCPLIIWQGYIKVTQNNVTTKLNAASDDLLAKLRPVWKNKDTGLEVEPDSDVTIARTDKYYVGPATAGTYTFTLQYNTGDNENPNWVDTHLPPIEASIDTVTMERVTDRSMFSSSREYAIVGEGENGQLYAMSMHADGVNINEANEAAAISVTPDNDGHIVLGSEPAIIFQPYHYLNTQRHFPRGDSSPETLLWDLGTGIFGRYQIEGYTREGSVFVSGDEVGRYGGLVTGDGGTLLSFAEGGAVTMYAPFMGHSEKYLRLVKNENGSYVFTSKTVDEDERTSYPVYLYRDYVVDEQPVVTETKYEYVGPSLDKYYDSSNPKPVKIFLHNIIATQNGTYVENGSLDQTGLYGKYVTAHWYKKEDTDYTEIYGHEISDVGEKIVALTGPSEPGDYKFVLQKVTYDPEDTADEYLTIDFTIAREGEHIHAWDNGRVTTEATCTDTGEKTYTCTTCGETRTEEIPSRGEGHDVGTWQYDLFQHWKVCNICGTRLNKADHHMGEWREDESVANGQLRICTDECGYMERRVSNINVTQDSDGNYTIDQIETTDQPSVEIPSEVFSAISNVDPIKGTAGETTVTVGDVSVTYSAAAVEAIDIAAENAAASNPEGSVSVALTVNEVEDPTTGQNNGMNDEQQAAVENAAGSAASVTVYSITLEVNTVTGDGITTDTISDFGEGTATVTVPYDEEVGRNDTVNVVRVEEDGRTTPVDSSYDPESQTVTWTTGQHSFYMITKTTASRPAGGGGSGSASNVVTADKTEHGTVTVSPAKAAAGTTVTVTVTPDTGYTLETLTVTDGSGKAVTVTGKDGKYTFTMPDSKVNVKATFMEDNTMLNFFTDVNPGDYFYNSVLWAAENGITEGTSDTTFSPYADCTRAQIVTFLWRAAGCPEPVSSENPFTDVTEDSYYYKAVLWAVEKGITEGTGSSTFSPDLICTRDQSVTFLWRAAGKPAGAGDNPFTDVKDGEWYSDAVLWAVENSITEGTGGGTFSPDANCTRGQIVTFLYRLMK